MSKIRDARTKAGFTMKELSERTGVPYRSLQNWESEGRTPPPYVEKMILKELENEGYKESLGKILDKIAGDTGSLRYEEIITDLKKAKDILEKI